PDQRSINRALIEKDGVAADLLDAASDAVAVLRAESGEGLKDHEVERALEKVELRFGRCHLVSLLWDYHSRVLVVLWECHRKCVSIPQVTVETKGPRKKFDRNLRMLFMAEGDLRVDFGGAAGGEIASQESGCHE